MAKVNFIRNYARKNLMKVTDEGIMVIPNTQKVDFQEAMLKQLLIENGINPNAIKSDAAMNEAMAFINQSQKTNPPSTEAKVFDLKGDRLDPRQNIMGGTQEESIKKNIAEATKKGDFKGIFNQVLRNPDIAREFEMMKKFPFRREENVRSGADAIPLARKAEFDEEMKMKDMAKERDYSVEQLVSDFKKFGNATDKDIQTIMKSGKMGQIPYVMDNYGMSYTEVLDTLKRGKPLIEGMAQGGRIGYKDGPKLSDFIDIQASGSKSGKQQIPGAPKGITMDSETYNVILNADIPINEKINLLTTYGRGKGRDKIEKDGQELFLGEGGSRIREIGLGINKDGEGFGGTLMYNMETGKPEIKLRLLKRFAEGGRIGLKDGMDRRTFMKIMGGLATLPIIGKFLKPAKTAKVAKDVSKVVPSTQPPSYFFDLVNKIKTLGSPRRTPSYRERVDEYQYTGKDGNEYLLTEELDTGDIMIQKDKIGGRSFEEGSYDVIEDRTEMVYKKGRGDETTQGTPADEYEEYKVEFDQDGTAADATEIDELSKKEIIKEATGNAPPIKKASGGLARMLGE